MEPTLPNWIADQNKFNLPEPPKWALKTLYDFDAQLVIIPSRRKRQFWLARRRLYSAGYGKLVMVETQNPDVHMFYDHGLVDVAPIKTFPGQWTGAFVEKLKRELKARDIWEHGGATKMVNLIEDWEADQEIKRRRSLRDDFYHRAGDAWRSMQARIGSRNKRASDYHGVARLTTRHRPSFVKIGQAIS